jgi:acyl-coenzyme A synthetase/AMP-(fatty) acid ligase
VKQHPLIARNDFDRVWILTAEDQLTVGEVLFRARTLSQQLPDHPYCLLLCERRVNFIIGFLAALWRGQTALLPPNRSPEAIQSLIADYPDSCCLTDADDYVCDAEIFLYHYAAAEQGSTTGIPLIDSTQLACLVFTSGSTGKPAASTKYWGDLVQGAGLLQRRYEFNEEDYLVATVPAQHMYGLETTVLLPMMYPVSVYGGMPFFPEDIRRALSLSSKPATLITTPLHLRVCVQAGLSWPQLHQLISATAPLSKEDATRAEREFGAGLREIYGSTESGAIASRNTVDEQSWVLYDDVKLIFDEDSVRVDASHLPHRPILADRIEALDDEHFLMYGRTSDMIKIAGKRASLADLNLRLNSIPGVEDGIFMQAEAQLEGVSRLCAVIVAPELSQSDVINALRQQVDPVFLPRPLFKVDTLPRNETGKLPHSEMMKLLEKLIGQ